MVSILSNDLRRSLWPIQRLLGFYRLNSTTVTVDIEKLEQDSAKTPDFVVEEEELLQREAEIERKRNKSRLKEPDRRFLLEQNPYLEPTRYHHGTLKYLRRTYGRYGEASGVDPAICWPVKEELDDAREYEKVAYPYEILKVAEEAKQKRREQHERIWKRQHEIAKKLEKLDEWKRELAEKIKKKEGEALAAKERKERLMEEVRMHFGYTVDPRDERFKQLLEKKEKEQKKAMKEARKKAREESVMAKMLTKKSEPNEEGKKKQPVEEQ